MSKQWQKLIEQDPYLAPHAAHLERRCSTFAQRKKGLLGRKRHLSSFAQGHRYFGLHRASSGWTFREWAPNATKIFLVGPFSDWKSVDRFLLTKISESGVWEITLTEETLKHLDYFRLQIVWDGGEGERIPSYANYVVQDSETKLFCARVWNPPKPYRMRHRRPATSEAPVIYEAHIGMASEEERVATYAEFTSQVLPRIACAGYNTVQLMGIMEHPYYGSFGYQVSNFFAPSSRFGTPDELKKLIDTAHKLGIRVIMDLIHSHAVKNELEGLGLFDGTQYQYFHQGGRGLHPAWDSYCFNYAKDEVVHFLLSNCHYWLGEFNFDGFRFDGITSMLYHDHGLGKCFTSYDDYYSINVDEDALCYLTLANQLIDEVASDAITICEDMSGMPGLALPISDGGIGFGYNMAMGVPDYWIKMIKERRDEEWSVEEILFQLTNRRSSESYISYSESHDQALVGDKSLIFRLIDQDMYTNMGIDNRNQRVDRGIALIKMIHLITAITARGGYLNFMGNEFGHPQWIDFPREGNGWSYHHARRQWSLVDRDDLCYQFIAAFNLAMIKLIREYQLLNSDDGQMLYSHLDDQVLAFERQGVVFIFNFHPHNSYQDYQLYAGDHKLKLIMSSDDLVFGGEGRLTTDGEHFPIEVDGGGIRHSFYLPTRSVLVLR
jgi:1,4-alpha-glucan branching enzyme